MAIYRACGINHANIYSMIIIHMCAYTVVAIILKLYSYSHLLLKWEMCSKPHPLIVLLKWDPVTMSQIIDPPEKVTCLYTCIVVPACMASCSACVLVCICVHVCTCVCVKEYAFVCMCMGVCMHMCFIVCIYNV